MKESKAFRKHHMETYLRNAGRAYSHSSLNIWHQPKRPNITWDYTRQLSLSVIIDPYNQWKASGHMEPVESAGKVAKRGKSYKAREKWQDAGRAMRHGWSDKVRENCGMSEKVYERKKVRENCQNTGRVTKRGKSDGVGKLAKHRTYDKLSETWQTVWFKWQNQSVITDSMVGQKADKFILIGQCTLHDGTAKQFPKLFAKKHWHKNRCN